jgi:hypothetical protein
LKIYENLEGVNEIDDIVRKSTKSKAITLAVRDFGRGTDFICFDKKV